VPSEADAAQTQGFEDPTGAWVRVVYDALGAQPMTPWEAREGIDPAQEWAQGSQGLRRVHSTIKALHSRGHVVKKRSGFCRAPRRPRSP
jgi:hypothetical protein